jgi:hypothetical protein
MTLPSSLRRAVARRARDCCEYCHLASVSALSPFHVDHIIPLKHGGSDELDNLCLACFKCNAHKGHDLSGFDPSTGKITQLYHPRQQVWTEHFAIQDDMRILGLTPEGRTTVQVLQLNDSERVENREVLSAVGEYPCEPG